MWDFLRVNRGKKNSAIYFNFHVLVESLHWQFIWLCVRLRDWITRLLVAGFERLSWPARLVLKPPLWLGLLNLDSEQEKSMIALLVHVTPAGWTRRSLNLYYITRSKFSVLLSRFRKKFHRWAWDYAHWHCPWWLGHDDSRLSFLRVNRQIFFLNCHWFEFPI